MLTTQTKGSVIYLQLKSLHPNSLKKRRFGTNIIDLTSGYTQFIKQLVHRLLEILKSMLLVLNQNRHLRYSNQILIRLGCCS